MGNLVADAMRAKYPRRADAAITNSGGLRQDIFRTPPTARRAGGRDHLRRGVRRAAVRQPTVIETLTYDAARGGVRERVQAAVRRLARRHGPHAAVLGPAGAVPLHRHDAGDRQRSGSRLTASTARRRCSRPAARSASSPTTSCSPGGDGYTAFTGGTNVLQHGRSAARRGDRVHHGATRRSRRWSTAGGSVRKSRIGGHGTIRVVAPALLERDAPLSVLLGALRGAEAGRGSTALISGEAGIGKTSLVRAFVGRARARLLVAACDDLVTPRTLGPLWDAAPDGGPLARALGEGREVFGALMEELSLERPTVLVIEDAHWADDATHRRARLRGAAGGVAGRDAGADRARRGARGRGIRCTGCWACWRASRCTGWSSRRCRARRWCGW